MPVDVLWPIHDGRRRLRLASSKSHDEKCAELWAIRAAMVKLQRKAQELQAEVDNELVLVDRKARKKVLRDIERAKKQRKKQAKRARLSSISMHV